MLQVNNLQSMMHALPLPLLVQAEAITASEKLVPPGKRPWNRLYLLTEPKQVHSVCCTA